MLRPRGRRRDELVWVWRTARRASMVAVGSSGDAVNANAFSPCGKYLVCGTSQGRLHFWRFEEEDGGALCAPCRLHTLLAHGCAIYALTFTETKSGLLLLSGADEEIRGWRWSELLAHASGPAPAPVLRFENPRIGMRRGAEGQLSETSALAVDAESGVLYSAAGDGKAYAWDLAAQACVTTFDAGLGEPLHCLALAQRRKQLATGGEDGALRLWDLRSSKCEHTLRPDAPPLVRPPFKPAGGTGGTGGLARQPTAEVATLGAGGAKLGAGKVVGGWCGCVGLDEGENWMAAGWGDGFLVTIEMNMLGSVACLPTAAPPTAVCFEPGSDFSLVSVGAESALYSWRLTGELETRAACSSPSALGLAVQRLPGGHQKVIAVGGSTGSVDVFTDTSHRAFTLRAQDE